MRGWGDREVPRSRGHGGIDAAELRAAGVDPAAVVDFSVNVNPYGPSPAVLHAIRSAPVHRYPDPTAAPVREALAARTGLAPDRILFGNGAADLLWSLARVTLGGGRALVVEPAFSELEAAARSVGAAVAQQRATAADNFEVDFDAVSEAVARHRAGVVYLCAPTTPSGAPVAPGGVERLAARHGDVLVLLDESFLSLSDRHADAARPLPGNVVRIRSMTKEHAIPGLRAGYLTGPPALVGALERARPAWSTSSLSQAAALAGLADDAFVTASRDRLRGDREALAEGLRRLGLEPTPSVAPYLAFPAPEAPRLRARLLSRGLLVRDCASFGMPGWLRVAARPPADRERLLAALAEELR
jgi:histidinol-phosphate/aromatic aminotransferase/cobyric acid decarboxylase-like protein